jgi:S-adenosylmethionine:tRNA ribosyltransferase-isomerase
LVVHAKARAFADAQVIDLPDLVETGDLLVVNDAATLPASLPARSPSGARIEIRLAQDLGNGMWRAVLFGAGDWRTPTELRDPPDPLERGAVLEIAQDFAAEIVEVASLSSRLVTIRFNRTGSRFWAALYGYGRPIQYSYHVNELPLWSVQTVYAARPWSMEMPSAGQPLTWSILLALKRRGIKLAWLTHSAGLSAAGDEDLDAKLPFSERYDIPQATVDAIEEAHRRGSRVIAVGTTVVRALEGSLRNNDFTLRAGSGETDLVIDKTIQPLVVNGILTGVHDPSQSHFRLLRIFADETTLRRAWRHATEAGYLCHEFGDLCLIA